MTGGLAECRKKYIIERKDGEKVVARKQGITTSTCLTARPLLGDQSSSAPSQTCKQVRPAMQLEAAPLPFCWRQSLDSSPKHHAATLSPSAQLSIWTAPVGCTLLRSRGGPCQERLVTLVEPVLGEQETFQGKVHPLPFSTDLWLDCPCPTHNAIVSGWTMSREICKL